jgi:hypothetical protein
VQFAFFNLITWAPWMLLGPVMGRAYLGGAAVWGAIMGVQGAGAIAAGLLSLGRRPGRPIVVATIGTFCYALPDIPMALHASAVWVAAAAFGPLAAAFGPAVIFGVGAVYGLLSSAAVLTLRSVRHVTWLEKQQDDP